MAENAFIVDCHTHLWESASQLGMCVSADRLRCYPSAGKAVSSYELIIASEPANVIFLLGFRSSLLEVEIPNRFIADTAYQHRGKIIGFAGIDPNVDNIKQTAEKIRTDYRLAGFVISPSAQGFHPESTKVIPLYEYAQKYNMPIIVHNGSPFGLPAVEFSSPLLWTHILREYSEVKFIFTDMGWGWEDQIILMLTEFNNIYVDLAGFVQKQWQGYTTLLKAYQTGVIEKFLLASDFPASNIKATIEAVYSMNQIASNTNLPIVPRHKLRQIVERNTIETLGLGEFYHTLKES